MKYDQLIKKIIDFRDSHGWEKDHNLKNLAESVNIEATEIMEIFQWKKTDEVLSEEEKTHLKGEIADTLIYLIYMCDQLDVNLIDITNAKMEYNRHRTWETDS